MVGLPLQLPAQCMLELPARAVDNGQSLGVRVRRSTAAVQLWITCLAVEPDGASMAALSDAELGWSEPLSPPLRRRYRLSRTQLRHCLAPILDCAADRVPLHSPPGDVPLLGQGCGCVSISHSGSGLLLAWSPEPIGVDLEHSRRRLAADSLMRRFFPEAECRQLAALEEDDQRQAVLRSWVLKEAAIKCGRGSLAQDLSALRFDHHHQQLWREPDRSPLPSCGGQVGEWLWAAVGAGVERPHWNRPGPQDLWPQDRREQELEHDDQCGEVRTDS